MVNMLPIPHTRSVTSVEREMNVNILYRYMCARVCNWLTSC